jgi:hypothetical protein
LTDQIFRTELLRGSIGEKGGGEEKEEQRDCLISAQTVYTSSSQWRETAELNIPSPYLMNPTFI